MGSKFVLLSRWLAGLLLVESSPQLSSRIARPFDLQMLFGFNPQVWALSLPVSLEHLATGHPFAVFECFRSLLMRLGPWTPESEMETYYLKQLTLSRNNPRLDNWGVYKQVHSAMWILAAWQWQKNLEYLKETFKRRRLVALARPGMRTYLPLIDLRQQIVGMRDHLPHAQSASDAQDKKEGLRRPSTMSEMLARMSEEFEKLDKELNDEIHLIIGAVTVQDSDANKTQTERATLLTLLAAFYLPLTLVTGIFGMNIKDISEGAPSWRACCIVLAAIAACTIVFVLAYRQWRVWRRGQQERERTELGFDKFA